MGETLNLKEAAAILGISDTTLRRWLHSRDPDLLVPHWRSGPQKHFKFDEDEVIKWKESRKIRDSQRRED
jgi:excisionase family DNA binding protein